MVVIPEESLQQVKATRRRATLAAMNLEERMMIENQVMGILHKRVDFLYKAYPQKKNNTRELLPVYKVPSTIFEDGPDNMLDSCSGGTLQRYLDSFFTQLIEVKKINTAFTDRLKATLNKHAANSKSVEHIRKIHQLVHSDIIKIVKAEWRNIFLNYIFMGCLPQGVEKARLYIGDALTLPLLEVQEHF